MNFLYSKRQLYVAVAFALYSLKATLAAELFFSMTYRDFLPASCFFVDLGNSSNVLSNIERAAWSNLASPDNQNGCDNLEANTAWLKSLGTGLISGHPDFEADPQHSDSAICTKGVDGVNNFPVNTCFFEKNRSFSIVDITLRDNDAGIPQLVYCDESSPTARCGFVSAGAGATNPTTQSNKFFFDLWYKDDPKYSKRIGQRLKLDEVPGSNGQKFIFDSGLAASNDAPDFGTDGVNGFFPLNRFKNLTKNGFVDINTFNSDPRQAPAWPKANNDVGNNLDTGFWFTTELHTTFEFRRDADMNFEFSGDDDFWAFVDGKMAMDLGGIHATRTASLNLNGLIGTLNVSQNLGLVDGEVYTLDIFHAERQRIESNFKMTTALFPACNVIQSGTLSFNFFETGVSSTAFNTLFQTAGSVSRVNANQISLAQQAVKGSNNYIFTKIKENVGRGFLAQFTARVDGPTFGFAFVVHNRTLENYPISGGSNLNFKGVTNSFAVVFNLCADLATCVDQVVSLHYPNQLGEPNSPSDATKKRFDNIFRDLKNGGDIDVEIIYYGGKPNFLEVYIGKSLFLRDNNFNLIGILDGLGGHVGLTATTSNSFAANVDILNFNLTTVEVKPNLSELLFDPSDFEVQTVVADGESESEGFEFNTKDLCENQLQQGSLTDQIDAYYIEQVNVSTGRYADNSTLPQIIPATLFDPDDGTYAIRLKTTVVSEFFLAFAFGKDCSVVIQTLPTTPPAIAFVPTVSFSGSDCLTQRINDAAISTPVIILPTEAPTPFVDQEDNSNLIVIISSVGGSMLFFGLLAAMILVQYRRKWNKDKGYVADGNIYKMELNTKFDGADEYTNTGKNLMRTQEEIQRLQAQKVLDARSEEIAALSTENQQMKALIRESKQRQTAKGTKQQVTTDPNPKFKPKKERTEFV